MKSFEHHARRLLDRMVQAETVTDPDKARKIVRKAEKHREKLSRLHHLLERVGIKKSQNSPPET
jgi:hypothetical protein